MWLLLGGYCRARLEVAKAHDVERKLPCDVARRRVVEVLQHARAAARVLRCARAGVDAAVHALRRRRDKRGTDAAVDLADDVRPRIVKGLRHADVVHEGLAAGQEHAVAVVGDVGVDKVGNPAGGARDVGAAAVQIADIAHRKDVLCEVEEWEAAVRPRGAVKPARPRPAQIGDCIKSTAMFACACGAFGRGHACAGGDYLGICEGNVLQVSMPVDTPVRDMVDCLFLHNAIAVLVKSSV